MKAEERKEFFRPIIVLVTICLVISAALAFTNNMTAPVIRAEKEAEATAARQQVLPDADSFSEMTVSGLPETVTSVYKADNGTGYVFMLTAKGYGGDMELICGIGSDGKIVKCQTLSHSETSGLGSKTADEPFKSQFAGKDSSLSGVDTISGATISSKAYIGAIRDAFTAYDLAKEAEA